LIGAFHNPVGAFRRKADYKHEKNKWDFNELRDRISWIPYRHMNILKDGYYIYDNDPILKTCAYIDADKYKYIKITYKTNCKSDIGQIFFDINEEEDFKENRSKMFNVNSNNVFCTYLIDMSDNIYWKGMITRLRFDPAYYDFKGPGTCIVKSIEVTDEKPEYCSVKDFCNTQGINGWSYHYSNKTLEYKELSWDIEKNLWVCPNDYELYISVDIQSSCNQFATIRKWSCPVTGKYKVILNYSFLAVSGDSELIFKKNHINVASFQESNIGKNDEYNCDIFLETGDSLFFEIYNKQEIKVECLVDIHIEKLE
jgi:hypothetical protein